MSRRPKTADTEISNAGGARSAYASGRRSQSVSPGGERGSRPHRSGAARRSGGVRRPGPTSRRMLATQYGRTDPRFIFLPDSAPSGIRRCRPDSTVPKARPQRNLAHMSRPSTLGRGRHVPLAPIPTEPNAAHSGIRQIGTTTNAGQATSGWASTEMWVEPRIAAGTVHPRQRKLRRGSLGPRGSRFSVGATGGAARTAPR